MKKTSISYILLIILFVVASKQNFLYSQPLNLTISQAEAIFLQNNLQLIAERYNINIAEANVIQARLFENPELTIEHNIYTIEEGFGFGKQNLIQLEQLLELAGKRKKRTNFEKINLEIAQQQFQDVLRELKNGLKENFITTFYLQKSILVYDKGINYLQKLIDVYEKQYEKGNVSLIEKARLKALLFGLQTEKFEIEVELIDARKELNLLLNLSEQTIINPILDIEAIHTFGFEADTYNLLVKELDNAPQMQIAKKEIQAAEANFNLQKAMRIPDLTIGASYEREGYFRPESVGILFNIPIPIFNRNQGEIGVAAAEYEQSKILFQYQEKEMLNELYATFSKANEALKFYQSYDKDLENDFEMLMDGITLNFERRTISMLEFIDYYETYKEVSLQLQTIEKETILSIEAINFLLGKNYFRIIN